MSNWDWCNRPIEFGRDFVTEDFPDDLVSRSDSMIVHPYTLVYNSSYDSDLRKMWKLSELELLGFTASEYEAFGIFALIMVLIF